MVPARIAHALGGGTLALKKPAKGALQARTAQAGYGLFSRALAPALLGWLWWRGRREPGYRQNMKHRLGFIDIEPESFGCIWLHAASVGEVQAAQPLIKALLEEWPAHALVVSTQTPTGAAALRAAWGDRLRHVHAPLDTPGASARFLERLQPRMLILMERELWPGWLRACRHRLVPVALVNARLTEKSCQSYQRWRALMQPVWAHITVAAADAASAERFAKLGVSPLRISQTGNLKFDVKPPESVADLPADLQGRTLVVAGSTHEADEAAWLDAWGLLAPHHPKWLLVLVPRHPQRFDAVAQSLKARGLPFARISTGEATNAQTQVLLVDRMGELMHWYGHATLCFVGGTLAPIGGHNPLEPLAAGKPILFGPHTHNAAALFDEIERIEAGLKVQSAQELVNATDYWLTRPEALRTRAEAARALLLRNQGATQRTLAVLKLERARGAEPLSRLKELRFEGQTLWHDPDRLAEVSATSFDPAPHTDATTLATGSGRGQAHLVQAPTGSAQFVLRHYRRGGLMAKISHDRFWQTAPHQSRAMQEFALLRLMRSWGLPVPRPIAARHASQGFFYRADILVEMIPGSRNVAQLLGERRLGEAEWRALGQAIRQMHDRQVFHSDLNCHNLLLDGAGHAWVVDFDKCGVRAGEDWKAQNLARLLRSLRKESKRMKSFEWNETDWEPLIHGYNDST